LKSSAYTKRLAVVAVMLAANLGLTAPAHAKSSCVAKVADGTGNTQANAKFQVYEALLQATDMGAWASWMANGTTPGYKVKPVTYRCIKGTGLGVTCRGRARVCKV
jgi:hypothetical protein